MYTLTDAQHEFIRLDLRARGIGRIELQDDLLDHVCCIIERNLEPDGDFEGYYAQVITTFYQDELSEIEKETIQLLTFKNYYAMKNTMIRSGSFATLLLVLGLVFKFMHWPGAAAMLVLSILLFSLLFLPLVFILKAKETTTSTVKWSSGIGIAAGMSISLGILFKVMHWPFANMLVICALLAIVFLFLPIYFFTGIRNPDTKVNTIVTTIVIVVGCGMLITLVRSPRATTEEALSHTALYYGYEQQLSALAKQKLPDTVSTEGEIDRLAWFEKANGVKVLLLKHAIGMPQLPADFKAKQLFIEDNWINELSETELKLVDSFKKEVLSNKDNFSKGEFEVLSSASFFKAKDCRIREALLCLNQFQLSLLLN
jgi:hypothetical protein